MRYLWVNIGCEIILIPTQSVYIEGYHIILFRRHGWLDTNEHMASSLSLQMAVPD